MSRSHQLSTCILTSINHGIILLPLVYDGTSIVVQSPLSVKRLDISMLLCLSSIFYSNVVGEMADVHMILFPKISHFMSIIVTISCNITSIVLYIPHTPIELSLAGDMGLSAGSQNVYISICQYNTQDNTIHTSCNSIDFYSLKNSRGVSKVWMARQVVG